MGTASSLYIKSNMPEPVAVASSTPMGSSAAAAQDATYFAPSTLGDRPSGFGATTSSADDIKPITSGAIDAELITEEAESDEVPSGMDNPVRSKKQKKKKKKKKKKKSTLR